MSDDAFEKWAAGYFAFAPGNAEQAVSAREIATARDAWNAGRHSTNSLQEHAAIREAIRWRGWAMALASELPGADLMSGDEFREAFAHRWGCLEREVEHLRRARDAASARAELAKKLAGEP